MPYRMRSMHTTMKSPTPMPTASSSTVLSMLGTVSASTCRSGSATVTATPSAKATSSITGSLPIFVSAVPILLPMMVMERSAPKENSPSPTTIISAPMRNVSSRLGCMGTRNRHSTVTMAMMGSTDTSDSLIFSVRRVRVFSMCAFRFALDLLNNLIPRLPYT